MLDTNVLASGFLSPHGPPGAILRSILAGSITLCLDERILTEYRDVLTRGRFAFVLLPRAFVDEHRPSISNFIEYATLSYLAEDAFVSDDEMSDILADTSIAETETFAVARPVPDRDRLRPQPVRRRG